MKYFILLVALLVLAVSLLTGCGVSKDSYDAAVKEANELRDQLSDTSDQLSDTSDQLSDTSDQLSVVQTALADAQDDINSYKSEISSLQDEITDYESQVADYESQIAPLQYELESKDYQITYLQNQIAHLNEIGDLSLYSTEADAVYITMITSVKTPVVSFTADYAGYIVISGTSSSFWGVIFVTESFDGYPFNNYQYDFGKGATLIVPVLPGTITVYFATTQASELVVATITVDYYY
jgi:archaellum component FlaC